MLGVMPGSMTACGMCVGARAHHAAACQQRHALAAVAQHVAGAVVQAPGGRLTHANAVQAPAGGGRAGGGGGAVNASLHAAAT